MKTNLNLYQSGVQRATPLFTTLSLVTLAFVLITTVASAQTKTITGIVRDEQQQALASVSVSVKGTQQGVLTDTDGRFSINVELSQKPTLVFSYMGKQTVDLPIGERTHFEITLYENVTEIAEIVILSDGGNDELYSETRPVKKSSRKAKKGSF